MRAGTLLIIVLLLGLILGTGCKKKSVVSTETAQSYQQLPDATNVLAALNQKNYEEAVSGLVKLKDSVATEEQQNEYAILSREVKDKLLDASPTDPKAQEALQAFRLMTMGR